MIIEPENINLYVKGNVICRNSRGEVVFTLTPHEISVLSGKSWIEGKGRYSQKNDSGVRDIVLMHVCLLVAMKDVAGVIKRRSVKQIKTLRMKAEDSKTWIQTGPTSFAPHIQRCAAFANLSQRIGVVQV